MQTAKFSTISVLAAPEECFCIVGWQLCVPEGPVVGSEMCK